MQLQAGPALRSAARLGFRLIILLPFPLLDHRPTHTDVATEHIGAIQAVNRILRLVAGFEDEKGVTFDEPGAPV